MWNTIFFIVGATCALYFQSILSQDKSQIIDAIKKHNNDYIIVVKSTDGTVHSIHADLKGLAEIGVDTIYVQDLAMIR